MRRDWWTKGMLDAWAAMTAGVPGTADLAFAVAIGRERARLTGRRQRVVLNNGHTYSGWRFAVVEAPEVAEPCS